MARPRPSSCNVAWSIDDLTGDPHQAEDKARRVQQMFAAIAHSYDLNNRVHSFGRDQAWRRRAVSVSGLRPTDDVLDAACGTGDLAEAFVAGGARTVVGVDFTVEMLELARKKTTRIHRPEEVGTPTYLQADVMALPFADESYDIVSMAFGIRNVSDPHRALGEFHRVLRPGGRLIILEFSQPTNRLLRLCNRVYTDHIMPLTATILSGDRSGAYRYLPKSIVTFPDRERFQLMLRSAGFSSITQHPMTFGVCVAYVGHVPE